MFDILIIGILIISGIIAVLRGFIREALGILSWILATFAAMYGYSQVSPFFDDIIANKTVADAVSGVIIAIVILVICTIIISRIQGKIKKSCLKGLDSILGFVFGLLRGWLIILLLYVLALIVSPVEINKHQEESRTLPYVAKSFDLLENVLPDEINEEIANRIEDAEKQAKKRKKEEKETVVPKPKKRDVSKFGYDEQDRENLDKLIDILSGTDTDASSDDKKKKTKAKAKPKKDKTDPWAKAETSAGKDDKTPDKSSLTKEEMNEDIDEEADDE